MKLSEKFLPKALKNKQQVIEVNIVYNIELNFSAYDDWEYLAMNTSESKWRQQLISSLSNICYARKKQNLTKVHLIFVAGVLRRFFGGFVLIFEYKWIK